MSDETTENDNKILESDLESTNEHDPNIVVDATCDDGTAGLPCVDVLAENSILSRLFLNSAEIVLYELTLDIKTLIELYKTIHIDIGGGKILHFDRVVYHEIKTDAYKENYYKITLFPKIVREKSE